MAAETRTFGQGTSRIRRGADTRSAAHGRLDAAGNRWIAESRQAGGYAASDAHDDGYGYGHDEGHPHDRQPAHGYGYRYDQAAAPETEPETWQGYEAETWQAPAAQAVYAQKAQKLINGAGALTSLALILGLGVWGYKLAVRDVAGVPVIRALEGPSRMAPADPGGQLAEHTGLSVNEVAASGEAAPAAEELRLAPQPEALGDDDLAMGEMRGQDEGPITARGTVAQIDQVALRSRAMQEPLPEEAAEPILAAPTVNGIEGALAMAIETIPASVPGVSRSLRPHAKPGSLRVAAPAAPPPVRSVDPASLGTGTRLAQLGAYETAEAARAAWDRLAVEYGALFTGKGQVIQAAESAGRSFYRLRAVGFDTDAEARGFCAALSTDLQCVPVTLR
ncbi:SPOR domain-containing protein [Frigidibacter sp. MR17.24]|uniref:SPOR domain-containing protein n=1 Tax=Frigidibacter sp. MR17.24 TaxID=3127345 RepID=UPI003012BA3E